MVRVGCIEATLLDDVPELTPVLLTPFAGNPVHHVRRRVGYGCGELAILLPMLQ